MCTSGEGVREHSGAVSISEKILQRGYGLSLGLLGRSLLRQCIFDVHTAKIIIGKVHSREPGPPLTDTVNSI